MDADVAQVATEPDPTGIEITFAEPEPGDGQLSSEARDKRMPAQINEEVFTEHGACGARAIVSCAHG